MGGSSYYGEDHVPRPMIRPMNLEGSAAYLRKQMADQIAVQPALLSDSSWMQTYTLCMVAAELEAMRALVGRLVELMANSPERTQP